jgi:hypothetical protein
MRIGVRDAGLIDDDDVVKMLAREKSGFFRGCSASNICAPVADVCDPPSTQLAREASHHHRHSCACSIMTTTGAWLAATRTTSTGDVMA